MTPPRLSICIPVYNFAAFLGATLESIVPQAGEEVEIVILDGGSTDDTPAVVARFQERCPRLHYVRRDRKGGIDRDMAYGVAASRGEYVWLFSGDDIMRPDGVARILAELPAGCDVYLLEAQLCSFGMTPIEMHTMLPLTAPRTFRLGEAADRAEYFGRALNSATFFSFCSSLVIRRATWDRGDQGEAYDGTCWAHAARLLSLVRSGLTVRYLPGAFLDKRGDNDSFLTNGITHRLGIAVDGYYRIADETFGRDSMEAGAIRDAIRREIPWHSWVAAKEDMVDGGRLDQRREYRRLIRKQFPLPAPGSIFVRLVCAMPIPVLRAARRVKRALRGLPPPPPRRPT